MADEINIQDLIDKLKDASKKPAGYLRLIQQELAQRSKTVEQYAKLNTELKRAIQGNKDYKKLSDEQRKLIDDINDAYSEHSKVLEANRKIQKDINEVGKRLTDNFFALGDAQTQNADKIEYYTKSFETFPYVGKVVNEFGKSLDFNVELFKALASLGADFNGSLVNLRLGARDALLPLMEFVDLIKDNSNNLALLFGTVNRGTSDLSNLSKGVRENLLPNFAGIGVTTDEINDYLTTFLALQRVQGRQEFRTTQATTGALRSYITELDKVAKLTGIQRQELDKAVRAQQADAVLQSYLKDLAPQRRAETTAFIAGLGGMSSELGRAVSNILATGFPLSQLEQNLVALNPGFAETIRQFGEGSLSVAEATNQMKMIANATDRFGAGLNRASPEIFDMVTAFMPLRGNLTDLNDLEKDNQIATKGATREIILLQESFRKFKSQIEGLQTTFLEGALPLLANGFKISSQGINSLNNTVGTMAEKFPEAVAMGVAGATVLKYTKDYAKEVGIIATGTAIGTSKLGTKIGEGAMKLGAGSFKLGAGVALAGLSGSYAGTAESGLGKTAGVLGSVASGALAGSTFGPAGTALGAAAGLMYGLYALGKNNTAERAIGGPLSTNQLALVGERGPELFLPSTSGSIEPISKPTITTGEQRVNSIAQMTKFEKMFSDQNTAFKQFTEVSSKMEKHLNTLVGISAKTETNTGMANRRLANMSPDLV
jgi:hypothetical protein